MVSCSNCPWAAQLVRLLTRPFAVDGIINILSLGLHYTMRAIIDSLEADILILLQIDMRKPGLIDLISRVEGL